MIEAVRRVTGRAVDYVQDTRRPGDPAVLVASSEKAQRVLSWRPGFTDIGKVIETAWRWHQSPAY